MRAYAAAVVETSARPSRVFEVLTDWPRHSEWMFATSAEVIEGDGRSAGTRLAAFSGFGAFGFLDTMRIVRWEPPGYLEVAHTGRVVRGTGAIRIKPLGGGGSRIIWAEELDLPLGLLGQAAWPLLRPLSNAIARRSLRKLAILAHA